MKNEKDNISQFDELFKKSLENHSVQAPAGIFKAISAATGVAGSATKIIVGKWILGSLATIGAIASVYYALDKAPAKVQPEYNESYNITSESDENKMAAEENNTENFASNENREASVDLKNKIEVNGTREKLINSASSSDNSEQFIATNKVTQKFSSKEVLEGSSLIANNPQTKIVIKGNTCNGATFNMSVANGIKTDWFVNDIKLTERNSAILYQFINPIDYNIVAYQNGKKVADTFIDLSRTEIRIENHDLGYGLEQVSATTPGKWYYNDILISNESKLVYQTKDYPDKPYFISLDRHGCLDTTRVEIESSEGYFNIPQTAFTPNGDGINDLYEVEIQGYTSFSLIITDKNKKVVFSTTNPEIKWDGTYQSSGMPCEEETYFAIISYKLNGANSKIVKYEKVYLTK